MQKTINFKDFMNKSYQFDGLTQKELDFFDTFKNLIYISLLLLAVPTFMSLGTTTHNAITAFLYK